MVAWRRPSRKRGSPRRSAPPTLGGKTFAWRRPSRQRGSPRSAAVDAPPTLAAALAVLESLRSPAHGCLHGNAWGGPEDGKTESAGGRLQPQGAAPPRAHAAPWATTPDASPDSLSQPARNPHADILDEILSRQSFYTRRRRDRKTARRKRPCRRRVWQTGPAAGGSCGRRVRQTGLGRVDLACSIHERPSQPQGSQRGGRPGNSHVTICSALSWCYWCSWW